MDGGIDLSSLLSSAGGSDAISQAMSILMKKPELIDMIAGELSSGNEKGTRDVEEDGAGEVSEKPEATLDAKKSGDRERLLLALRPYLSERRQSAIDVMISLGSLGGLVGNIDPNLIKTLVGGKNV